MPRGALLEPQAHPPLTAAASVALAAFANPAQALNPDASVGADVRMGLA